MRAKRPEGMESDASIRALPRGRPPPPDGTLDRRALLKAMGASLALGGAAGCSPLPDEKALPYVEQPEGEVPGIARWYATAVPFAGYAQPLMGKTFAGRPVKLEGNPRHPASGGATDVFGQAALLGLFDPGRAQAPRFKGRPATWAAWDAASTAKAAEWDRTGGAGFRLLTGRVTSPTLRRQIAALSARWPRARWHVHEPADDAAGFHEATRLVFGRPLDRHLRLDRAAVVVSLDDDFLGPGPRQVEQARLWGMRRQAAQRGEGQSLLLAAEPTPTLTGIASAERLPCGHGRIGVLLSHLAAGLGLTVPQDPLAPAETAWVEAALRHLSAAAGGSALVLVGRHHPASTQALALLVNERLGAWGNTLAFSNPVAALPPNGARSLPVLAEDAQAGRVSALAMLDCDPVATAPGDLAFAAVLERIPWRAAAGTHFDATAQACHWHLPLAHPLESWSDARAADGTVSLVQPLIQPFWSVRPLHTIVENLGGNSLSDRDCVDATWRPDWGAAFAENRRKALLAGFVEGSAEPLVVPAPISRSAAAASEPDGGLTLLIRPSATLWDGRFAENAWLQELPDPVTKISWGNAVLVSPALAAERGWKNGDAVRVATGTASASGPVWIVPGQERNTVVVPMGGGRRTGLGAGDGVDASALQRASALWRVPGVLVEATGETLPVATTQPEHAMDGFDFVRTVARDELPTLQPLKSAQPSFYPDPQWSSPSWGMSIDLDLCIGCNACVTACQAENNIPVVGKELVAQGREMFWLRVDHYTQGPADAPEQFFQPVPCMHCEQAPCEMGCPVNAAVHSYDGLNLQVYNRCIGTRTCSSFCPYKVRRFNWFDFTQSDPDSIRAMRNPDVTVRQRGVMEKCTYCIQRIAEARITAQKEGRAIREGEVTTACQGACPTSAISFGNVLDKDSAVSRRKAQARDYALLEEANTRPRTTYLARITEGAAGTKGEG